MRGVYLVAAELARHGFIASPSSRSARAQTYWLPMRSANVPSQSKSRLSLPKLYWLLSRDYKRFVSDSHIYIYVSIREGGVPTEFFIIPSRVVAKKAYAEPFGKDIWYSFTVEHAKPYQERWEIFRGS
jgi:hypothetical protein